MVSEAEAAHGRPFHDLLVMTEGPPFEVCMYTMFVHAKKLETTLPLYTKYRILESERELAKFGLGNLPR